MVLPEPVGPDVRIIPFGALIIVLIFSISQGCVPSILISSPEDFNDIETFLQKQLVFLKNKELDTPYKENVFNNTLNYKIKI